MTNTILNETANIIYEAKIKSGKYSHYNDDELLELYKDCLWQAKAEEWFFC